ncbi:MAG: hypothetical protein AAFY98_08960 [Verrucomicrobiota bacterium]
MAMKYLVNCFLLTSFLFAFSHANGIAHDSPVHTAVPELDQAVILGSENWRFQLLPQWGKLPGGKAIGPTHGGVVVDPQTGLIYFSTDSEHSILVYQPDGVFVKSIAPECVGLHAMDVAFEEGQTFLYGAQLKGTQRVCKLNTDGELLMEISGKTNPDLEGGWKGLTSVAVAPDGSIFCSMGYGSNLIHKFDSEGQWIKTFGEKGEGQKVATQTCHGLKVDKRFSPLRLLVCDRKNRRLFHTDLEGNWIGEIATGLRRPCAATIHGDVCAVAELEGRVTLLDKKGKIITTLGDNPDQSQWAKFKVNPETVSPEVFTAPHGISFDAKGNLYVEDWNKFGIVRKLSVLIP